MKSKRITFSKLWDSMRSSYWFVPTLMTTGTILIASTMLWLDRTGYYAIVKNWGWIYTGGPDGGRAVLSAIAGSMVSVAATAFSITIVALQLASSNFGPRLLRNFMQDTGNQIVLGTFISTFIYSLLILRSIHGENYNKFIPQFSITFGMFLALVSIGVLIYFIHHASTIIQVSHVIGEVSDELDDGLYFGIQQVESLVIVPMIMRTQVSLLPAITLLSVVVFANFFGFLGLFLAIPLTIVLQIWIKEALVKDVLNRWKESSFNKNFQEKINLEQIGLQQTTKDPTTDNMSGSSEVNI